jgi:hypothetical membrane protein
MAQDVSAVTDYPLVRALLLTGVVAPILYALTVVWGATLFPGYSHLSDPISSLTQAGRSGTEGLVSLFFIYNALVIVYGITGISISLRRRFWVWSFGLLIATGLAGVLMWPFPQDPIGAPVSPAGIAHITLAAFMSLGSMGAIGAGAFAYRAAGRRPMALFSLVCLVVVFGTGLLAAFGIGGGSQYAGLFERITIGAFEFWMLVSATLFLAQSFAAGYRL